MLFDSKANADKAAAELASGKSFKDVYDEWSSKVRDAQQYSDVFPRQLPPPLATALTSLEQGGTTPNPVQSKLGWHLLHLDGTDKFKAPPLTKVKDQVRRGMQEKQAKAWVNRSRTTPPSASAPSSAEAECGQQPPPAAAAARSPVVVKDKGPAARRQASGA